MAAAPAVHGGQPRALDAAPSTRTRLARGYEQLVRLLALTLTVLLVAAVCEVAMDIVGWQCAGRAACTRDTTWLGFAAPGRGGWWSLPGRRLALAAAAPVALTVLLWSLSRRTWYAYESHRPADRDPPPPGTAALSLPGFWYGRRSVARLRTAHTAAGLLTVATALCVPTLRHDTGRARPAPTVTGWVLAGLLVLLGALAVVTVWRADRAESGLDDATDRLSTHTLLGGSAGLLAATAVYSGWQRPSWTSDGRLPSAQAFSGLTVLQGALIAALAVTAFALRRALPPGFAAGDAGVLRGQAGPAVALLGCALGGVLTGGVAQRAADWLDRGRTPGEKGSALAGPPAVLTWEASVIPAVLVLLLLVAAAVAVRLWRRERALHREVEALYPGEQHHPVRTGQIAAAIARAGLTDRAPLLIAVVCAAGFVLGGGAVAGAWAGGGTPVRSPTGRRGRSPPSPTPPRRSAPGWWAPASWR